MGLAINSLPHNRIMYWSKLNFYAMVESLMRKGKMLVTRWLLHLFYFPSISVISTSHIILPKPLVAFPDNHNKKNKQRERVREE